MAGRKNKVKDAIFIDVRSQQEWEEIHLIHPDNAFHEKAKLY